MDSNSAPSSSTSSAVSRSSMYTVSMDDTDTSTSSTEDNEDVETVKTVGALEENEQDAKPENIDIIEDDDDIDEYFNDIFPDRNRLDTVEEVTEPMSSFHESLPLDLDMAKIGSSGQPSSDFMNDSLPPDLNPVTSSARNSMTLSLTSREEFCAVSEIEVLAATWPPNQSALLQDAVSKLLAANEGIILTPL